MCLIPGRLRVTIVPSFLGDDSKNRRHSRSNRSKREICIRLAFRQHRAHWLPAAAACCRCQFRITLVLFSAYVLVFCSRPSVHRSFLDDCRVSWAAAAFAFSARSFRHSTVPPTYDVGGPFAGCNSLGGALICARRHSSCATTV
jgi:hypothetical protein